MVFLLILLTVSFAEQKLFILMTSSLPFFPPLAVSLMDSRTAALGLLSDKAHLTKCFSSLGASRPLALRSPAAHFGIVLAGCFKQWNHLKISQNWKICHKRTLVYSRRADRRRERHPVWLQWAHRMGLPLFPCSVCSEHKALWLLVLESQIHFSSRPTHTNKMHEWWGLPPHVYGFLSLCLFNIVMLLKQQSCMRAWAPQVTLTISYTWFFIA